MKNTLKKKKTAKQGLSNIKDIVSESDIVTIYKDPETETEPEGYAFVWDVQENDDEFYLLTVSFLGDPHKRKVQRKYKKR